MPLSFDISLLCPEEKFSFGDTEMSGKFMITTFYLSEIFLGGNIALVRDLTPHRCNCTGKLFGLMEKYILIGKLSQIEGSVSVIFPTLFGKPLSFDEIQAVRKIVVMYCIIVCHEIDTMFNTEILKSVPECDAT